MVLDWFWVDSGVVLGCSGVVWGGSGMVLGGSGVLLGWLSGVSGAVLGSSWMVLGKRQSNADATMLYDNICSTLSFFVSTQWIEELMHCVIRLCRGHSCSKNIGAAATPKTHIPPTLHGACRMCVCVCMPACKRMITHV